jgi:hypothetical protein
MSALKAVLIIFLLAALFIGSACAATVFAAGSKTVKACNFAVTPTAEIVGGLPYPDNWRVVVVCNENVWDTLMRQSNVQFISDYAFTFQANHVTFIRARVFREQMHYTPEQVLRHELGHIICSCDDEDKAWAWNVKRSKPLIGQ